MKLILKSIAVFTLLAAGGILGAGLASAQSMSGDSMPMHDKAMPDSSASKMAKTAANETRIEIKDFSFQPKLITVPVGAKIVWVNKDEEPHTVVSTDKVFSSKALDTDGQFSFTFDKPGTYEYFCSVHPRMVAKIVVVPAKKKQSMKMDKMN